MKKQNIFIMGSVVAGLLLAVCGTPTSKLVPTFTPDEKKLVLFEYQDTLVTIGNFLTTLQKEAGDNGTIAIFSAEKLHTHFLDNTIKPAVLVAEALKRGLDKLPLLQQKNKKNLDVIMAIQLHKIAVKNNYTFTDAELQKQFATHTQKYQKQPRVEMRHIQVKSKKLALTLMDRLQKGERIGALAATYTKEDIGKNDFGKSGNFPLGQGKYPDALEQVLRAMKIGDIRGPIRTPHGYHIIKLTAWVDGKKHNYGDVLPQIKKDLAPAKEKKRLDFYVDSLAQVHGLTIDQKVLTAYRTPSDVVATIGDETIFIRDINEAHIKIYQTAPHTPSSRNNVLQALISKMLFRQEAYARGFDKKPLIIRLAATRKRAALMSHFNETEIDSRITISEDELQEYYHNKRQRMRLHLFITTERELSHQIHTALLNGESIPSITAIVKERAKEKILSWDANEQENRTLVEAAFKLSPTHKISDIISVPSPDHGVINYYILSYKKLTITPKKPFEQVRASMHRELYARKRRAGRDSYYQQLYKEAHVRFYNDNMNLFVKRWIEYLQSAHK